MEYGPVYDPLVFLQAGHGGSFFGAQFGGAGICVLLEPCDSSDVDDGDDTACVYQIFCDMSHEI